MSHDASSPTVVRVAVGAVVEKMSTVHDARPAYPPSPPWRDTPSEQLRVLITQRKPEQVLGGLWELPGGKIEPGESPERAVMRELKEEVGIDCEPVAELPPVLHSYDHATVMLLPLVCQRRRGLPRPIEVADLRWVGLDELAHYRFPDASLPVIAALRKYLTPQPARPAHDAAR